MAKLGQMPPLVINRNELAKFGTKWKKNGGRLSRIPPYSSTQLGSLFDEAVANALSILLGSIPIEKPDSKSLTAPAKDCVELGPVRVIGGVRPQNFDVGYRPDGRRF